MDNYSVLELKDVHKIYDNGTVALQNINLSINQGDFVSIVGASGCGKSTILRLIANLDKISSGDIIWHNNKLQKELAFVFQEPSLMPWASIVDNIRLPSKITGLSSRQSRLRCAEAINLVGLEGFESAYPRQLSGGMKMRVSIARALVTQPRMMLMDEPFSALDDITRNKLNQDLLSLWQKYHWTVLFVTHNITEAVYLSNRVIVMASSPGRVINEVKIEADYPRIADFRTSTLCNQYCREIAHYLEKSMANKIL